MAERLGGWDPPDFVVGELSAALEAARAASETTVGACAVEPHRALPGSDAWRGG